MATNNSNSRQPVGEVFTVREKTEHSDAWWTKIGTAWKNKDGSMSITLDALPINGKLVIRKPLPPKERREPGDDGLGVG